MEIRIRIEDNNYASVQYDGSRYCSSEKHVINIRPWDDGLTGRRATEENRPRERGERTNKEEVAKWYQSKMEVIF